MSHLASTLFFVGLSQATWIAGSAQLRTELPLKSFLAASGPFVVFKSEPSSRIQLFDLVTKKLHPLSTYPKESIECTSSARGKKVIVVFKNLEGKARYRLFDGRSWVTPKLPSDSIGLTWAGDAAIPVRYFHGSYLLKVGAREIRWKSRSVEPSPDFLVSPILRHVLALSRGDLWRWTGKGWTLMSKGPNNLLEPASARWSQNGRYLTLSAGFPGELPGQERHAIRRFDMLTSAVSLIDSWDEGDRKSVAGISNAGAVMIYSIMNQTIGLKRGEQMELLHMPISFERLPYVWWNPDGSTGSK